MKHSIDKRVPIRRRGAAWAPYDHNRYRAEVRRLRRSLIPARTWRRLLRAIRRVS